jgi:DNA-binding LytR/AlgR family response regulator
MKVLLLEDEKPSAEKLQKALLHLDTDLEVVAVLSSVEAAVEFLQASPEPDLILMDIELSDGLSFRIFDQCRINCPVIFVTAYDAYWQEAFEVNSIDYVLKPVRPEKLGQALEKYRRLEKHFSAPYANLQQKLQAPPESPRRRFLVKKGTDWVAVKTEDVAYCYAAHKLCFLVDRQGRQFILDRSLADLEKELDPEIFYRVNRKYIVQLQHIQRITTLAKSRLLLELSPPAREPLIVAQEQASGFRQWMDR